MSNIVSSKHFKKLNLNFLPSSDWLRVQYGCVDDNIEYEKFVNGVIKVFLS